MSVRDSDKSKPYIPRAGDGPNDGYNKDGEATATCFCGASQLAFPTSAPGLVPNGVFVCNCTDCRKLHSSMLGCNFIVLDTHLKHNRGRESLQEFTERQSIVSGNSMTNVFCKICGTLMYRVSSGFPGKSILRVGTVDDFNLQETVLMPKIEQFRKDRVSWFHGLDGIEGVAQREESFF